MRRQQAFGPGEEPVEIALFCVCSEEWCYCMNMVKVPLTYPPAEKTCDDCLEGRHRWVP